MDDKVLSRRELFRRAVPKEEPERVPPTLNYEDPVIALRPPKSLPEAEFLQACTKCHDCVSACPHDALSVMGPGRPTEGTPYFVMTDTHCHLCTDFPCVTACKTGALSESQPVKIGRAFLRVMDCLASATSMCTVCVERCPVDAISFERGKPKIASSECVGCGECVYRCPAPTRAIVVLP